MFNEIEEIVIDALQNIYSELGIKEVVGVDSQIYGREDGINSLSLVRLIVDIEEAILIKMERSIVLADDRSLSMKNSPFISVQTLTNYILKLMHE